MTEAERLATAIEQSQDPIWLVPDAVALLRKQDALLKQALDVINSECGFGGTNTYDPRAIVVAIQELQQ